MEKNGKENIYLTWHYTTHGVAYLKHILSAFYTKRSSYEELNLLNISQIEMNSIFEDKKSGFLFDKIYYLTAPQKTFDNLSARRFNYKIQILEDEYVKKTNTIEVWKKIIELKFDDLEKEIEYVKKNHSSIFEKWFSQIWRNIHQYSIDDQIIWLKKYSNIHANYRSNIFFKEIKTKLTDLHDQLEISKKLKPIINELKRKHPNANFIINASLGSNETQVVWQVFSELNFLPTNTKLIRTYDNKASNPKERFKLFDIKQVSPKIISDISKNIKLYSETPKSLRKQLAQLKMKQYLKSGFAILILGERGIGKTKLAEDNKEKKEFISVNCASFTDDSMAESELFGYKKGAFTGADKDKIGLFEKANNGILFLDEIHHLNKRVQARLMKAIQTDKANHLTIRRLGDTEERKIQTILIFASNLQISILRKELLPDFYDRISQLIIELPALRETFEDITNEFEKIWKQMKFEQFYSFKTKVKNDNKLFNWLKTLKLYGNYRDLQKISISYKTFLDFDEEIKKLMPEKNAFEFTKNQFDKYFSANPNLGDKYDFFSNKLNVKQMEANFKKELATWAIHKYKSASNAAKHFTKLGGKTTKETLYKWRGDEVEKE